LARAKVVDDSQQRGLKEMLHRVIAVLSKLCINLEQRAAQQR